MDLRFGAEHEAFRAEAREWLTERLDGPFAAVRGRGGPGDEDACVEERRAWELELGAGGWIGLSWPKEYGGRDASLLEQVIFYEEYARAGGPGRVGIIGEGLLGPTIVHFGSDEQKRQFLPGILSGREIWCQGYSEPNAGSDLANVQTHAVRDGDEWVVTGQKVWTSLAHWAQWCFVLCRTNRDAPRHRGLSYLLVPMDQPGIEIRPIRQLTGTSEFNEVFFSEARTPVENVVGAVDGGWSVAMGTLAFERGASTLGQQLTFEHELQAIVATARGARVARRRAVPPTGRRRVDRVAGDALPRAAQPFGNGARHRLARDVDPQALLGRCAPATRRARDRRARERRLTPIVADAVVDDEAARSPACSSGRAPTRSTAAPTRSSATSSASGPSACRPSRR